MNTTTTGRQRVMAGTLIPRWVLCVLSILAIGITSIRGAAKPRENEQGFIAEPENSETEKILRLQIFLDEQSFGPGKIDGLMGQFTRKALAHYNVLSGLEYNNYRQALSESRALIKNNYTTYTVSEGDFKFVGTVPYEPEEQAKINYLYYRSIQEFVAERYHTDDYFLARINPAVNWEKVIAGSILRVPNVTPFVIEDIIVNKSFPRDRKLSKRIIIVDTSQKLVAIWEKNNLIATFPITPGQERFIYRGKWKMWNMITTPVFRWDKSMLETGKRSDEFHELPPGPNSPIGIFWAGLNKAGIGLHGTALPHTIGRSHSAGCIRLANWDVIRLPSLVRPGATVEIR